MESTVSIFIIHVIFHYLFLNGVESNNAFVLNNSIGKLYLSSIAGFSVILIMMIHRHSGKSKKSTILSCTFAIIIFTYMYRTQIFISDKQYLTEMLDHYESSLLTTNKIILKTNNELVKSFASKIIYNRASELNDINTILKVL